MVSLGSFYHIKFTHSKTVVFLLTCVYALDSYPLPYTTTVYDLNHTHTYVHLIRAYKQVDELHV